ncbi:MAG TPA: DEAD/DEAH box helicase [Mucilaginibacter sp.]|nr:DEAD/DEAH box helicase [Mucilaginibacter sp.]
MTFRDFNFNEHLTEGILSMGFETPTPIQAQAIPLILEGKDLIACAQTGTGKTASYLLPILHKIAVADEGHKTTALILAPTRELAQQIDQQAEGLAYFTGLSSIAIYGGGDGIVYEQQRRGIQNKVDILIGTPGRLIAHLQSGVLKLNHIKYLILDEADRMLDMGFLGDIMRIIGDVPQHRQTLLFSATMPGPIRKLANSIMKNPEQINLATSQPAEGISQQIYKLHNDQKSALVKKILKEGGYASTIIFANTKDEVKRLSRELKAAGVKANAFHSDFEQAEREQILLDFKNRALPVIIGTDALSRGIDVEGIDLVINYDVPADPEDYIHRIGRTARAETTGTAITLVNERDNRKLKSIEELIGRPITQNALPPELGEAPAFREHKHQKRRRDNNSNKFRKKKKPGNNGSSGGGSPLERGRGV